MKCHISGLSANGPRPFAEFCKRSRDRLQNSANGPGTVYRILQTVRDRLQNSGGGSDKNTFFGGFLQVLCAVSYFFMDNLYMKCLFCKKKSFHLTFSSHRSAIYKVPPRIGGHHFLLCQQTNTKDIAGQSASSWVEWQVNGWFAALPMSRSRELSWTSTHTTPYSEHRTN